MIFLKTDDEIELLRQSNLLVGKTLAEVAKLITPGVTTRQLDKVAEEFIRDHGYKFRIRGLALGIVDGGSHGVDDKVIRTVDARHGDILAGGSYADEVHLHVGAQAVDHHLRGGGGVQSRDNE